MSRKSRASWPPRGQRPLAAAGAVVVVGGALLSVAGDGSAANLSFLSMRTGTVTATVGAAGNVETGREREVGFGTSGTVTNVYVKEGQTVKAGQLLARLDSAQAQETVTADVAALAAAQESANNVGTTSSTGGGSGTSGGGSTGTTPTSGTTRKPSAPATRPATRKPTGSATPTVTPTATATATPAPTRTRRPTTAPTTSKPSAKPTTTKAPTGSGTGTGSGSGRTGSGGTSGSGGSGPGGSGGAALTQDQADANVLKAQVALRQARRALAGTRIVAPTAGTVLSVSGAVGDSVNGPGSSGFVTLGDLDELQVKANFSESDVARLAIGQPAKITLAAGNGGPFDGTVAHIEPAATTSGSLAQYGVMISFDQPPGHLLIGQTATVQVTTQQAQGVLYLPPGLLRQRGDGTYAVVVERRGKDVTRTVRVGLRGDQYVEISSGLAPGDKVKI